MNKKFNFDTAELSEVTLHDSKKIISGRIVTDVSNIHKGMSHCVAFIKDVKIIDIGKFEDIANNLIIINSVEGIKQKTIEENDFIISKNPRLAYAIVLKFILEKEYTDNNREYTNIGEGIVIGQNLSLGENVYIEPQVKIGHNVTIGAGTTILSGVVINDNVKIGKNCIIRNNTVIGGTGFGTEKDDSGRTYRIPHLGSVIIGDNVDIGSLNTVVAGTINPTIIEDNVMSDDHVHIAHNCYIEEGTMITACVEISGSVRIGKNSMIGPNSSLMNKITLGENTVVGLGTVVTKSFTDDAIIAGNPADIKENLKIKQKILNEMVNNYES